MRITKIRDANGKKIGKELLSRLVIKLDNAMNKAGFVTGVEAINGSSINVSKGGCSFTVNVAKLGYNARINSHTMLSCKASFKRTSTPTWKQREDFNHLINTVLDKMHLKANIKSGEYIVRSYEYGRVNEWNMPEVYNTGYGLSVPSVLEIVPIDKAQQATEWVNVNAPYIAVCA